MWYGEFYERRIFLWAINEVKAITFVCIFVILTVSGGLPKIAISRDKGTLNSKTLDIVSKTIGAQPGHVSQIASIASVI